MADSGEAHTEAGRRYGAAAALCSLAMTASTATAGAACPNVEAARSHGGGPRQQGSGGGGPRRRGSGGGRGPQRRRLWRIRGGGIGLRRGEAEARAASTAAAVRRRRLPRSAPPGACGRVRRPGRPAVPEPRWPSTAGGGCRRRRRSRRDAAIASDVSGAVRWGRNRAVHVRDNA